MFNPTCPDDCSASDCVDSYVVEGSTDLDGDGAVDLCYTDGSGYYNIVWTGGCLATNLNYSGGDIDITANGFTEGLIFFGFDAGIEETIIIVNPLRVRVDELFPMLFKCYKHVPT